MHNAVPTSIDFAAPPWQKKNRPANISKDASALDSENNTLHTYTIHCTTKCNASKVKLTKHISPLSRALLEMIIFRYLFDKLSAFFGTLICITAVTRALHFSVYATPNYVFKIHFNIKIPHTTASCKCSLSFTFPYQNAVCCCHLLLTCNIPGHSQCSVI